MLDIDTGTNILNINVIFSATELSWLASVSSAPQHKTKVCTLYMYKILNVHIIN